MTSRTAKTAPFDETRWTRRPLNFDPAHGRRGTHDLYEVHLPVTAGAGAATAAKSAAMALMRYRIFPPSRMRAHVCSPDERITAGVTVIQRVFIGPMALEMAVRVLDVFADQDGPHGTGFTYGTVQGHSERGLATFSIHAASSDSLLFRIESWSRPGNALAYFGRPVARLVQRTFTREALEYFRGHFRDG